MLFSGASGSSVANAAFGASTFQPELVKRGYPPAQAGAIIAATSVLDTIIPPSIAFLILASATNLSVGSLLAGGFVGGAVMAVALAVAIHLTVKVRATEARATGSERWRSAVAAIPAFGLGVIVVVGIRIGVVTTTEAAALAAIYTLLLGLFGRLGAATLYRAFRQAGAEASAIRDLRDGPNVSPRPPLDGLPPLDARRAAFRHPPMTWRAWVEAWDEGGTGRITPAESAVAATLPTPRA